ncbi:Bug family tripartite tricarboxylate transporter substrate binding protein [Siccirubricoccus phaeus]|uniref:Bug family tripartite tricarboxylate transporter substrate binding protein n=1 Tax=Siccirubricoccus phaeus TaxID=2595053 RepID=UPI00165A7CFD|nr:tripartite tricarboxylate transporter substrate binding protein [Siccirubricoccus phaeus]
MPRPILTRRALLAAGATMAAPALHAQPRRPIRLIIPFSAGGNTDVLARLLAPRAAELLGVPVAVENRPSASAIVGVEAVARAQPDGTTLLCCDTTLPVLPALHQQLPFDIFRDLVPLASVASAPTTLVVRASLPAKTLPEFIALAKAEPGRITYATGSIGGTAHLAALLLQEQAGIRMNFVPYSGAGQAANDLVAGHLDVNFSALNAILGLMQAGTIRALATSGAERQALAPELPTFRESGLPNVVVAAHWGFYAPAGLAPEQVEKIGGAFLQAAREEPLKAELTRRGYAQVQADAPAHARILREEYEKWGGVMRRAGSVG